MRTLIVLCAGGRKIDNLPIYLNRHPDGTLLAEKAIEGIFPRSYDRIIFTILKKDDNDFDSRMKLEKELKNKYPIEIVLLDEKTNGPADSVYKTIESAQIEGEFAVRDSLNGISIETTIRGNFIAGLDLTEYDREVFNVKSKSFIVINEQKQVLDVIEKSFRSDVISVGLYGFKNVSDFVLAYLKLSDSNYPIKKLYLSNIISYLIGYKKRVFHCASVTAHEDWGSKETWAQLLKRYTTLFIDIDNLIGECYNNGKIEELISKMEIMSKSKQTVVLFTRSNYVDKNLILMKLREKSIRCIEIVCGVPYSSAQLLVSSEQKLEVTM